MDGNDLERFLFSELGENGRRTTREHRFAGTGRAYQKHVMSTGGCDLQCPFRRLLTDNLGEIGSVGVIGGAWSLCLSGRGQLASPQIGHKLSERPRC